MAQDLTDIMGFRPVTSLHEGDELAWWFERVPIREIYERDGHIEIVVLHPVSKQFEMHSYPLNDEVLVYNK